MVAPPRNSTSANSTLPVNALTSSGISTGESSPFDETPVAPDGGRRGGAAVSFAPLSLSLSPSLCANLE